MRRVYRIVRSAEAFSDVLWPAIEDQCVGTLPSHVIGHVPLRATGRHVGIALSVDCDLARTPQRQRSNVEGIDLVAVGIGVDDSVPFGEGAHQLAVVMEPSGQNAVVQTRSGTDAR